MMLADDSREGIKMDDTTTTVLEDREDDNYYIQESSQAEDDLDHQNLIGEPINTN